MNNVNINANEEKRQKEIKIIVNDDDDDADGPIIFSNASPLILIHIQPTHDNGMSSIFIFLILIRLAL